MTDCNIEALISLAGAAAFNSCAMSKTPSVVIFPHVQVVIVDDGASATTTFTGPGFATNAAASDALRNLQVSPPATGADAGVAVADAGVATGVPAAVVTPDAGVTSALAPAPTDAAAPGLEVLPLAPHPAIAVARTSRTAPVMSLFMFDSFTRCLRTVFRR
jgi:hypothetical protein